jgi:hypothetical protein
MLFGRKVDSLKKSLRDGRIWRFELHSNYLVNIVTVRGVGHPDYVFNE